MIKDYWNPNLIGTKHVYTVLYCTSMLYHLNYAILLHLSDALHFYPITSLSRLSYTEMKMCPHLHLRLVRKSTLAVPYAHLQCMNS